jgi:hypothetical protein
MWPLPVSPIAASLAVVGVLAFGAGWYGNGLRWEAKYTGLELRETTARLKGWETANKVHREALDGYQKDLELIANRKPVRPVVVCPSGVPGAASGTSDSGTGGVPGGTGVNIGPDLAALADRADRCAAQLNALIKDVSHDNAE